MSKNLGMQYRLMENYYENKLNIIDEEINYLIDKINSKELDIKEIENDLLELRTFICRKPII